MVSIYFALYIFNVYAANAAVFLWSNKQLKISPLQPLTEENVFGLVERLGNPRVYVFKSPTALSADLKEVSEGYYSAYNPNGYINSQNATELLGDSQLDVLKIKETLNDPNKSNNILAIIVIPSKRYKRRAADPSRTDSDDGPVIYRAWNKNKTCALLYSSQQLLLKINDTAQTTLHLGKTGQDMIIYDNRLNVIVEPKEGKGKVTLRFTFSWLSGYWYLSFVKVKLTDGSVNGDFNLTTNESVMAAADFSYHCNGETVFTDLSGTQLHIYDLQVQPESKNGKFGDANDCVTFMTVPIWSGIFVTSLIGSVLAVGLIAIMEIKTMDKFDNQKTKNLVITISE